jgi:quercetin dioxygenase-like cupin family protein
LKIFASVIIVAGLFVTGASAMRAEHPPHVGQNLRDANWSPAPPLLPKGAEIAVLDGDPTKAAPYAVRLKFPAHYAIPAHSHPTDEHVVVTSGVLVFGMGDELDKHSGANSKLTVGGFVVAAANVNHFAFTRDEETTIVLYGDGPVEFNYVNPNDDPRNHPSAVKQQ